MTGEWVENVWRMWGECVNFDVDIDTDIDIDIDIENGPTEYRIQI